MPLFPCVFYKNKMADSEQCDIDNQKKSRSQRKRKNTKKSQLQAARAAKLSKRNESSGNQAQSTTEELIQQVQVAETVGPTRPIPNLHDTGSEQDDEPQTKRSRSSLKIGSTLKTDYSGNKNKIEKQEGFVLVDIDILSGAISKSALCRICGIGNLIVVKNGKQGLAHKLSFTCTNSDCGANNSFYTSKRCLSKATEAKQGLKPFEVNQRIIIAMRMLGQGLIGLNLFCGLMNIGIAMKQQTYTNTLKRIFAATEKASKKERKTAPGRQK